MSKWKCGICNSEFENYHAQDFDNIIYCPLCYYKELYKRDKKEIERLNNIINELEKEIISQIEICKEGQVLEVKVRSPFDTYSGDIRAYKYLLYKLKELKENNK